jgi:hypothetical protein
VALKASSKATFSAICLGLTVKCGKFLNQEMDLFIQNRSNQNLSRSLATKQYLSQTLNNQEDSGEKSNAQLETVSKAIRVGHDGYFLVKEIVLDWQDVKQRNNLKSGQTEEQIPLEEVLQEYNVH